MNNGKYNNQIQNTMFSNGLSYTLNSTLSGLLPLSFENGIIFNYSEININSLKIYQNDPWNLIVRINFSYEIRDLKNETSWNFNNNSVYVLINIENYNDPIYLVNFTKKVKITRNYYSDLSGGNLSIHVNNSYFKSNPNAPSFLQRLKGDFRTGFIASNNGIESLLNSTLENTDNSSVDYLSFSGNSEYCVVGMPNSFRLNNNSMQYYQRIFRNCNQFSLIINKNGPGTVSGTGINCGGICSSGYNDGTPVILTAIPFSGYTFAGWSGDCSGTGTCTLNIDQDKTITATFSSIQQQNYFLTVSKSGTGSGTITGIGINCGSDCIESYNSGTQVTLTAISSSDSTFSSWSGCNSVNSNQCIITMNSAKSVTATFDQNTKEIINEEA